MAARDSISHRQILSFVWGYTKRHSFTLFFMVLLLIVRIGLELAQPFFYKEAVDTVAAHGAGDWTAVRHAATMILFGALTALVGVTLYEIANRMLAWVETRIMVSAHADVFNHVERLSTKFYVNTFAGSIARKIGRGTDSIESILDHFWFNFLPLIFMVIGLTVVLFLFAPMIGLAVFLGMGVYIPFSIIINLYHARYQSWTDRQDTRVTASLVDSVTGNSTVKAFGCELFESDRHASVLKEWQRRMWKTWRMGQIIGWWHNVLLITIELTLLLIAILLWYKAEFTAGGFIVMIFYIGRLWGYMHDIGKNFRNYLKAMAHAQEMVDLYHMPPDVSDANNALSLNAIQGEIVFDQVTFAYDNALGKVFRNLTVRISPGEKVALVGHSGGGKSTFVKLLQRLYDIDSGSIRIDDQDIALVTQQSLRRSIGLVPQDPILFHRSLRENIAYGKPEATDQEIIDAAKKAHAHEFISTFPNGYDTLVGERGVKLSGGERQRVAIARVILANTPILILDEATSSLDSLSEKYIQEALEYVMEGRTTIVIAHRLSTIRKVDRILVIESGRIVEEGSHEALITKKDGVYRGFYELQAGGFIGE